LFIVLPSPLGAGGAGINAVCGRCSSSSSLSYYLGLGTHLLVKVPRPGDSEMTFSVFGVKLSPVTTFSVF